MKWLLERLLGLSDGFLSRQGEIALDFEPRWPGGAVGVGAWNFGLIVAVVVVAVWAYRRDGRSKRWRWMLATFRITLLTLVLVLLNRPMLSVTNSRVEPSVLGVMIDTSVSMKVRDAAADTSRLASVQESLGSDNGAPIRALATVHTPRLFRFDQTAATVDGATPAELSKAAAALQPSGQSTRLLDSLRFAAAELRGQRVAGLVVFTDGRESPSASLNEQLAAARGLGVKVFPVVVGSSEAPRNVAVRDVAAEDSAFVGDIVSIRVSLAATGLQPGEPVTVRLLDARGNPLASAADAPTETVMTPGADGNLQGELRLKPTEPGTLDLVVDAATVKGEIDDSDNRRPLQISVLDSKVSVLYVDGYPRWEYRYLKTELIRDPSIDVSCLLTSADLGFAQEGDKPITRFPETIDELLEYDVLLIGDVDPRQFTDNQLQLISEFVARRGGGFAMIAGPRYSPHAYRGTAIEAILPVTAGSAPSGEQTYADGFRPVLTLAGERSGFLRFLPGEAENAAYIRDQLPSLFWFDDDVTTKPGVGEAFLEHPTARTRDNRPAPLLVAGRFGAGRTLFSGLDDTWRWRFYTGEGNFDSYWVRSLRYLARGKKLGDRRLSFGVERAVVPSGETVRLSLRVLDPQLVAELPDRLCVELHGDGGGESRRHTMTRQPDQPDTFTATLVAGAEGSYTARLAGIAPGVEELSARFSVTSAAEELRDPRADPVAMQRLAAETGGAVLSLEDVPRLNALITSAERRVPLRNARPLWDSPLAMAMIALLLTGEWILRKWNNLP